MADNTAADGENLLGSAGVSGVRRLRPETTRSCRQRDRRRRRLRRAGERLGTQPRGLRTDLHVRALERERRQARRARRERRRVRRSRPTAGPPSARAQRLESRDRRRRRLHRPCQQRRAADHRSARTPRAATCDIGAFEREPPRSTAAPSITGTPASQRHAHVRPGTFTGDGRPPSRSNGCTTDRRSPRQHRRSTPPSAPTPRHALTCKVTATGTSRYRQGHHRRRPRRLTSERHANTSTPRPTASRRRARPPSRSAVGAPARAGAQCS